MLLRTVALSTLIIEAVLAVLMYPSLLVGGVDPLDGAVGGAVLLGDGLHEHGIHARTPAAWSLSRTTTSS